MVDFLHTELSQNESEVPLSVIFSDNQVDESLYAHKKDKVNAFILQCQSLKASGLSIEEQVRRVVMTAIVIEFGPRLEKLDDMVNTISQAVFIDSHLKFEVLHFLDRQDTSKIDSTLIN